MKSKNLRVYKDEFIKLYKEGYSLRKIGEMYGVSKASITKYVKEDCELRVRGLTDKQKEDAKSLYLQGLTVNAISKSLGLPGATVKNYLSKEYGIVTNGEKKYEYLKDDIVKDYESGLNATQISEKYKVSRQTVMNYVAESNIKARTYSETSRVYRLKENYFVELDDNKAAILGMIFNKGRIGIHYAGYYVEVNVHNNKVYILDMIVKNLYYEDSPRFNKVDNNLSLRIKSKELYDSLKQYGIYDSSSKKAKVSNDISCRDSFWKGYIYAGMSINARSIVISGNENHINELCEYLDSINIGYQRGYRTNIAIQDKKEIKKLIENHGYSFIKTSVEDYINNLDKNKKHNWSRILNLK